MGPPLSPRETRRSGRRSAPSVSASASKSPDSDQPPREKATVSRVTSSSSSNRSKKLKQEEYEDAIDDRKPHTNGSSAASSSSNGANSSNKAKRKAKDEKKEKPFNTGAVADVDTPSVDVNPQEPAEEEEEQGITRCVCGSTGTSGISASLRFDYKISFLQRMTPMRVNSWSSVKHAKCGNMAYVWGINLKTKFTTMIITANSVDQSYTLNSLSELLDGLF